MTAIVAEDNAEIDWGNERLTRAQKAVEANIYDVDSWSLLIREAQTRSINDVRTMYEKLITAFPTTGRYWKIYIEQEMKARNFEKVEKGKIGKRADDVKCNRQPWTPTNLRRIAVALRTLDSG